MPNLRLENIDKVYDGGVQAVYDFNIDIEHGEFIVLVGPSGCGKSTVLRMIAGLEEITNGGMYLEDKRLNDVAPADRDISMVFQNYALYGHMSVYSNMGFSLTVRHEDSDVIHEKVMDAADIVGLHGTLNRFPKNLSGGQRQRVALGRSIVGQTSIVLMDEPLSNLDAKLRVQSRRELTKLHQTLGSTFVYVTHDQTEAMTMADRIVVMNGGRIQQIASPSDIYSWPENIFVAGFIGSPPMNFLRGEIDGETFVGPDVKLKLPKKLLDLASNQAERKLVLGIRPENFSADPNEGTESLVGEIVAREFLGDRALVYVQVADAHLAVSLKSKLHKDIGETIKVYIDMDRIHLFDPKTEKRLRRLGDK